MRRVIKAWLETGVLDGDTLFPTTEGTPQGGVISPLLANVALHGLENELRSHFVANKRIGKTMAMWKPIVIRYAADFVVLHRDEGVIRECHALSQEWLRGMGLELKPSKTRICHTLKALDEKAGFDFLGFTVRQVPVGKYHPPTVGGKKLGFKTIIKPSKQKVKLHQERLSEIVHRFANAPQKALIKTLNPIIRGWCNYYRTVCSARLFQKVDAVLYHILYCWAKRRHPNKGARWVVRKYWHFPVWVFGPKDSSRPLYQHSQTKIIRHVKVKGDKSPFDGDWTYWASRQASYPGLNLWVGKLLKKQNGRCLECGLLFMPDDLIEEHHVYHNLDKSRWHLELLHRHCHDKRPAPEFRIDIKESG